LYFDGSSVGSFAVLCEFCETLIGSKLRFAEFPANDFDRLLRLRKIDADDQYQIEQKEQIYRKFAVRFDANRGKPATRTKRAMPVNNPVLRPPLPRTVEDRDRTIPEDLRDAVTINPATLEVYRECIPDGSGMERLLDLMRSVQGSLSIEALFEAIS
jgi:hypothetical protein